jgi:hypothetical protein
MPRSLPIVVAGLLVSLLPRPAAAWNSVGHLAIAKLAYDRLDDGEKLRLYQLLKAHPHFDQFLAAGRPAGVEEAEWVVMRAAVWPDWVRPRDKDPRGPAVTKYHRSEDHYVNVPLVDPKDADAFAGKTLVGPDTMNVVAALKQRCNEVRARNVPDEDKAVALCWVFHLVGDVHQPLHNVSYFADSPAFRDGDLGGNKFGVKANGKGVKLHAFWDDVLGDDPRYADDSADRQARIHRQATTLATALRGRELGEADRARLEKNRSFQSWSDEGFELAKAVAYRTGDGTELLKGVEVRFNQPVPDTAAELGEGYLKRARETAEVQAILAGRRLADRVRQVLAK